MLVEVAKAYGTTKKGSWIGFLLTWLSNSRAEINYEM